MKGSLTKIHNSITIGSVINKNNIIEVIEKQSDIALIGYHL